MINIEVSDYYDFLKLLSDNINYNRMLIKINFDIDVDNVHDNSIIAHTHDKDKEKIYTNLIYAYAIEPFNNIIQMGENRKLYIDELLDIGHFGSLVGIKYIKTIHVEDDDWIIYKIPIKPNLEFLKEINVKMILFKWCRIIDDHR